MIVYSIFTVKINSVKVSGARKGDVFLLPLVTNRKTPDREIWGSFKVHVHFTCIFLSFLGLRTVWSVSLSGCFYCRCPVAVLSKVVGGWGELPPLKALARYRLYLALVLSAKTMKKMQWQQKRNGQTKGSLSPMPLFWKLRRAEVPAI